MTHDRPLQTFISYSRVNKQFAIRLASELKSAGFCIWMDMLNISTGARWDEAVEKALRSSQIFVFIMTPASVTSENAMDEVGYAIDHGKYILPVLLEPCDIPLRLHRLQYVDFTQMSFQEGIENAKGLLANLVKNIENTTTEKPENAGEAETPLGFFAVKEPKTAPSGQARIQPGAPRDSSQIKTRFSKQAILRVGFLFFVTLIIGAILVTTNRLNILSLPPPSHSPTASPIPSTATPTLSNTPTSTSIIMTETPQPVRTFRQDFSDNGWIADWTLQLRHGNPRKQENFVYTVDNGDLNIHIGYEYVWGYFLYKPEIIYDSVELEAVVSNLKSTSSFGLVCQAGETGWYEFDITGEGLFYVRYVDGMGSSRDEDRNLIDYGSIRSFKDSYAAQRENVIRVQCTGNILSLWVNDDALLINATSRFPPQQGQIGFTVRSFKNYPIEMKVKSIEVADGYE